VTVATNRLIDFYCGTGTDHRGRHFADLVGMDDAQLERTHDFIQWLFPTVTTSPFNPDAPPLDATTATRLRADPVAQARLREALLRMLGFYGFELDDSDPADPEVVRGPAFDSRSRTWLTPGNHNYRRLSRMLASLVVLGRRPHADALFRCLESLHRSRHGGEIGDHALSHWRRQLS